MNQKVRTQPKYQGSWYTVEELAEALGCEYRTALRRVQTGEIPSTRPSKAYLIAPEVVRAILEDSKVVPPDPKIMDLTDVQKWHKLHDEAIERGSGTLQIVGQLQMFEEAVLSDIWGQSVFGNVPPRLPQNVVSEG